MAVSTGHARLLAVLAACAAWGAAAAMPSTQHDRTQLMRGQAESATSAQQEAHFWPRVRGHVGAYGTTTLEGPDDLAEDLAWSWHHPDGRYASVMLGGALMDSDKNLYVFMERGIFKLSPTGKQLWNYTDKGQLTNVGSIMGDRVFGNSVSGYVFALSLETGEELWSTSTDWVIGSDTAYVESHAGVVVSGVNGSFFGGNNGVMGLNASNGDKLWHYAVSDAMVWNIMAMFPDDDTCVFMDLTGGVYRLGLHNGTEIWHTKVDGQFSFSDGGLILGPDGDIYTCSNPAGQNGQEGQQGKLRKFALADGRLLWDTTLPYPCNSWPAVSANGSTVVVVPGSFEDQAPTLTAMNIGMVHAWNLTEVAEFSQRVLATKHQRQFMDWPELRAAIMAFNATTGAELWKHDVVPWGGIAAAGDEEGVVTRLSLQHRSVCLPAHWSAPTIDAKGVVYVGRASGEMYRYSPSTGESTYTTGSAGLHSGTTFAPGVMAYADCDSLYVWHM